MEIGKRIKELRKATGLTQQKFADRIGLKRNTIGNYEINLIAPSDRTILDICREFDVSENWLRSGEGSMFEPRTQQEVLAGEMGRFIKNDDPVKNEILLMLMESLSSMTEEQFSPIKKHMRNIAALLSEKE